MITSICQETTADQCASLPEQSAVLETLGKNVHTILSAIRNKAHYNGQLAIENYYSVDAASATANGQSALLNSTVDGAAKPFHVEVADGFGAFAVGRRTRPATAPAPPACSRSSAGAGAASIRATPGPRSWRWRWRRRPASSNGSPEASRLTNK